MFLVQTIKKNQALIEAAFTMHRTGLIRPDTYLIDVDTLMRNAVQIRREANKYGIKLFFMLKQLGRNPYLAGKLVKAGYSGVVCVDYREAQIMMDAGIPIGNIGHLVQIPEALISSFVAYGPEFITVYSFDKAESIQRACGEQGKEQSILLRVFRPGDACYSGQCAGFLLEELPGFIARMKAECPLVKIKGVTAFPCFLFDYTKNDLYPTKNLSTICEAGRVLKAEGVDPEIINTPSATCVYNIKNIRALGGNCAEPGHGLTGTTPMHAVRDLEEEPAVVYVSEISHNFMGNAYCYGGGYYRRSRVEKALVGASPKESRILDVTPPLDEAIDYHLRLSQTAQIGDTVLMAFRFQMFVCRSDIALIEGLRDNSPRLVGIYDCTGRRRS